MLKLRLLIRMSSLDFCLINERAFSIGTTFVNCAPELIPEKAILSAVILRYCNFCAVTSKLISDLAFPSMKLSPTRACSVSIRMLALLAECFSPLL